MGTSSDTPVSAAMDYVKVSPNIKSAASVHVKFEYDKEDDNIKVINVKKENEIENFEIINITSERETSEIAEQNILKAPSVVCTMPKIGDVLAFKVSETWVYSILELVSSRCNGVKF